MILIGSRALRLRCPAALNRKPLDFDWVCTEEEYYSWTKDNLHKINPTKIYSLPEHNKHIVEGDVNCEFEIIREGSSSQLLADLVKNDPQTIDTSFGKIPSLDLLFSIKDSHKHKKFKSTASSFYKTAVDWHSMRACGASIRPEHEEFRKLREKETCSHALPKLNMSKASFFKEEDTYQIFDHDDIHVSVARGERPAYTYYLKDGSEVACDKEKFFALPLQMRLNGIWEEAAVLSIERALLNKEGTWTVQQAFAFALAKVASSITGGWFRNETWNYLFDVLNLYPFDYWNKFQLDVKDGKVRKYKFDVQ